MRKPTVKTATAIAPVLSLSEMQAQFFAYVASNPDAQKALAMQNLLSPARATRGARKVSAPQSEADRACECAHFVSGNRKDLLSACIALIGEKAEVRISEKALSDATGLASYRVRPDMQTVKDRLSDFDNPKFPRVREIGYSVRFAEELRGSPREYIFSRTVAPTVAPRKPRKAKGKAVAVVPPANDKSA